jgi:tellurite resistance protein
MVATNMGRATDRKADCCVCNFPVSMFAVGMGVTGLGLAWRMAAQRLAWDPSWAWIGEAIIVLAVIGVGVVAATYLVKLLRYPDAVRREFANPVASCFFATITISLTLMASAAFPYSLALAKTLWVVSVAGHFSLSTWLIGRWLVADHDIGHLNPGWFIPAVGNIVPPVLGPALGFVELSWFLFAVGLSIWMIFLAIVVHRLVFQPSMPAQLIPTLVILIAPPAVGFMAWVSLVGGLDGFGRVLFYLALFFAILLASRFMVLAKIPFKPSWWAYTFPLDALTMAALTYWEISGGALPLWIPILVLAVTTTVVALVSIRTVGAALSGDLFAAAH